MADGFNIKLTGFKELEAALGEFTKATERGILRRVAVKALEPIVEEAKIRAPVDEGDLRDSIVIGTKLTRGAKRAAKGDPVDGVRVFAGTANRNAVPREFGTFRTAAHPFMRPAWDYGKGRALDDVMTGLGDEIERARRRAAKRKG